MFKIFRQELILFIVPFWNDLKKITRIKNSLIGINAVSVGFKLIVPGFGWLGENATPPEFFL
jgi:hypothetical protein